MAEQQNKLHTVAIVGGGLGGLALAQHMARLHPHIRVTVYERDAGIRTRKQGYFIGLNHDGLTSLNLIRPRIASLDSLLAFEPSQIHRATIVSGSLNTLMNMSMLGADRLIVSRRALRESLCENVDIAWNKRLLSIEEYATHVSLSFEDGSRVDADFVVGADGAHSRIRQKRCPTLANAAMGLSSCGGTVATSDMPIGSRLVSITDRALVISLGKDGHTIVSLSARQPEVSTPSITWWMSWPLTSDTESAMRALVPTTKSEHNDDATQLLRIRDCAAARAKINYANQEVAAMISSTEASNMIGLSVLRATLPQDDNPLKDVTRITLIGDSLHTMTMHRGLGANTAFVDALKLAEALGRSDWKAAVAEFQHDAFIRSNKALREASGSLALMHSSGLKATLRNVMFWCVGWITLVLSFFRVLYYTYIK